MNSFLHSSHQILQNQIKERSFTPSIEQGMTPGPLALRYTMPQGRNRIHALNRVFSCCVKVPGGRLPWGRHRLLSLLAPLVGLGGGRQALNRFLAPARHLSLGFPASPPCHLPLSGSCIKAPQNASSNHQGRSDFDYPELINQKKEHKLYSMLVGRVVDVKLGFPFL